MGGKSYFCDYCECFMKNDVHVRKKHMDGLPHKIAKANCIAKYRDPHELLKEDEGKVPCSRFHVKGDCKFGLFCHFSHYTPQQISDLRVLVDQLDQQNAALCNIKTTKLSDAQTNQLQSMLPWKLTRATKTSKRRRIPPSLKPIKFFKITEECLQTQWG